MSYQKSNPPQKLLGFPARAGSTPPNSLWAYRSGDDRSVIETPGYFTDVGPELGSIDLRAGDIVLAVNAADGAVTLHSVREVVGGSATVSRAVPR